MIVDPNERLEKMEITLPPIPKPLGASSYLPAVVVGQTMFLSGVLPIRAGRLLYKGKVGNELTVEQGYEAARFTGIMALAIMQKELENLRRVAKFVKVVGHIASAPGFNQQPSVLNGASEFFTQVFGDVGRHARLALGVSELPMNAPVSLEIVVEVDRWDDADIYRIRQSLV